MVNIASELVRAMDTARGIRWELEQDGAEDPFEEPKLKVAMERLERERAQFIQRAKDDLKPNQQRASQRFSWRQRLLGR